MSRKRIPVAPQGEGQEPQVKRGIQARTPNQDTYLKAIEENWVTLAHGPSGTGKDYCAVGKAIEYKLQKRVEKILICRPAVEAGEAIGYLKGDYESKLSPYVQHFYDILDEQVGKSTIIGWEKSDQLEVLPLGLIRGRTWKNSFVILSEAQNATLQQLIMFLTRIGTNTKIVINGDLEQSDLGKRARGGFSYCLERLFNLENVGIVQLTDSDIVRSPIIGPILERLRKYERE